MNRKRSHLGWLAACLLALLLLAACSWGQPTPLGKVIAYSLGETTIVQEHFPEGSPFRYMPVRLDGVIGVPGGEGSHPVVLILHGSHAICPANDAGQDQWPCDAAEEQKNYEGYRYLVGALADEGYVALAINLNAEHTLGYGEAPPATRMAQLIDLHLDELAAAGEGKSDAFGADLHGRVDLSRLVWIGHSRGAEFANRILRERNLASESAEAAYGPVQGLIQIAPSLIAVDSLPTVDVALATILPACDGDVVDLAGQGYYESARLDPDRQRWATTVYLDGANHNHFSTVLEAELEYLPDRPDCAEDKMLPAEDQQDFTVQYVLDYLRALYGGPEDASTARQRLGLDPSSAVPSDLYGCLARLTVLHPAADRLTLIQPQSEADLAQNLLGGKVTLEGATALFCPQGYYVPANQPGTEPCKRVNFNQPGYPQQFVLSWDTPEAELRTTLPDGAGDLSGYAALHLRAAVDPLSELNAEGQAQSFTVDLADATGARAQVVLAPETPALAYPVGVVKPNEFFEGGLFTGHVHMGSIVIPLTEFGGIDLSKVVEVTLPFDQQDTGTLLLADLEFVAGE